MEPKPNTSIPPETDVPPVLPEWQPPQDQKPATGFFQILGLESIRNKIIFSLLIIYVLGSLAAVMALFSISHMEKKTSFIESFYELNQKILETRRYEKNYLLYGNISDLMNALDYIDEVRSALETLRDKEAFPRSVAEILRGSQMQLEIYADLLQHLSKNEKLSEERLNQRQEKLRQQGHILTKTVLLLDNQARDEIETNIRNYRKIVLLILVSALFFGALLSLYLARWIIEPLQYIRRAVARIMRGELSEIPVTSKMEGCVECTELIHSLNRLLHALASKQDQLVQSTKLAAIGKVTAGIAHEINNPLNNISLTAEVLLDDLPNIECDERLEMVHDIVIQAERAREVVRHLLDFSRARKPSAWKTIDLAQLLNNTLMLLKNQFALSRVNIQKDLPACPVTVLGNSNQLQQVLVNIILNGIQAMGQAGHLLLTISSTDSEAAITIQDKGPGIAEDIRRHIFDPFFTTKDQGTGLGLSVSAAIIKEHKGDIIVTSEEGKGTSFRIVLPCADTAESNP